MDSSLVSEGKEVILSNITILCKGRVLFVGVFGLLYNILVVFSNTQSREE
jgi:hypothetical protein